MDGDGIRVPSPTAYYLAHLISALDRIHARGAGQSPPMPSSISSETGAGWGDPSAVADILPFPGPAAGWVVPMSA